jgi:Scramblase
MFIGYEQANRYRVMTPSGDTVAYLAEEDLGFGQAIMRQAFRTHRGLSLGLLEWPNRGLNRSLTLSHQPFDVL